MKSGFILYIFLMTSVYSFANESLCYNHKISLNSIAKTTGRIIGSHSDFKLLRDAIIEVRPAKSSPETFFKTFFSVCSRISKKKAPTYRIYVNRDINNCPPSKEAIEAILVHELFHIKDYAERTNLELIALGITYLTDGATYERETDLRTVHLGYGPGLIDYRYWIYSILPNEKALRRKIRFYMTPDEIRKVMRENLTLSSRL